jgi:Phosphodiester glycosidase
LTEKRSELWYQAILKDCAMQKVFTVVLIMLFAVKAKPAYAQTKWINVDSLFAPLPNNFHVYKTTDSLEGKPFVAYYAEAKLKDKNLDFTTDTTYKRRLTPQQFFEKNNLPLLVVNGTFFSFTTNQNLNVVIKDGEMVSYNVRSVKGKGKDSLTNIYPIRSALGITKKRNADVAWLLTDSSLQFPVQFQEKVSPGFIDPYPAIKVLTSKALYDGPKYFRYKKWFYKERYWKMKTAIGGGPVLVQDGKIKITNNEEMMFTGKAIEDKHPRTCMGYTKDGRLIVMVIQGRFPGIAEGASLTQQAQLLVNLGCIEALNLDGGGSSCMLINGKETIKPSDKEGERAVPAVFIITNSNF